MKNKMRPKKDEPRSCFFMVYYIKAFDRFKVYAKGSPMTLAAVLATAQEDNDVLRSVLKLAVKPNSKKYHG